MGSVRGASGARRGVRGRWCGGKRSAGISRSKWSALAMELSDCINAMDSLRYGPAARDLTSEELARLEGYYAELEEVDGRLSS